MGQMLHEPPHALRGARVLVVEDNGVIAADVGAELAMRGCIIRGPVVSVDGINDALNAETADAAVVDININGEMSFDLAYALRGRAIPIVFLSGYTSRVVPPDLTDCAFLRKPAEPDRLVSAVAAAVGASIDRRRSLINVA